MGIDDELQKSEVTAEIRDEAEQTIQSLATRAAVSTAITAAEIALHASFSILPFGVGSMINQMRTELAFQRVHERLQEMCSEWGKRLTELGEDKIDKEWFQSEEFQGLLHDALQQLQATSDKDKVRALGHALGNSGSTEFKGDDRKQLFVQLLRDLTPQHISVLLRLHPVFPAGLSDTLPTLSDEEQKKLAWNHRREMPGSGTDALVLQMLSASGLVQETLHSDVKMPSFTERDRPYEIERKVKEFVRQVAKPPTRTYKLSELGRDFLAFVGLPNVASTRA